MPEFSGFQQPHIVWPGDTEFDVETGRFVDLEIRSSADGRLYYFYDTGSRRLIKAFILQSRPRVETLCDIVLIKKGNVFTPRLTIWKRDKGRIKVKGAPEASSENAEATGRFVNIKARVDVGECHDNFWKLIDFLRTCKDIELPDHSFRIAGGEEAELIASLQGHDKPAVLAAVRTYLGGQITEQDVQMLLNRRAVLENFRRLMDDPRGSRRRRDIQRPAGAADRRLLRKLYGRIEH
jgi:hypothetical protein